MTWNVLSAGQWQRYVRSVCKRANLRLEWSKEGLAATDGKTIWVPAMSWPMTEEQAARTLSTVIHESSHVQHSDFTRGQALRKAAPATFTIWNIIEDNRIEYLPSQEWPGDRLAFSKTAPRFVDDFVVDRLIRLESPHWPDPAAKSLEEKLFAVALWDCAERARTWAPAYTVDPKHRIPSSVQAHMAKLSADTTCRKRLNAALPDASMAGSNALADLAEHIAKVLGITQAEQNAAKKQSDDGTEGNQGAGADGGKHKGMASEMGAGEKGAAVDQAKREGKAQATNEDSKGQRHELDANDVASKTGKYAPMDPAMYKIEDARSAERHSEENGSLDKRVAHARNDSRDLHSLASKVRKLLQIASQTLRTYGHKSGRLHGSALHRLAANVPGYSQRVFRREECQLDLDVAVHLLIDASGSMGVRGKMTQAIIAGEALSTCIGNVLGVPTMVSLFSTTGTQDCPHNRIVRKFADRTVHPDTMTERLVASATHLGNNNNDGESVAWAVDELRGQRAKRKFLIVLSDGMPSSNRDGDGAEYLKEVVRAAEALPDLEVHGIGILSSHVKKFYSNATVLQSADQLGECVMALIGDRLLKS